MKTTELVAWVGATTGIASLIWNIYTKITANRPKLVVKAYANMIQMPPPLRNPRYLRITVQNIGTAPTTLTNVEFFNTIPKWQRFLTKLHLKKRTDETEADHTERAQAIVRLYGIAEFFNPARCQGLCKSCHSRKTALEVGFAGAH